MHFGIAHFHNWTNVVCVGANSSWLNGENQRERIRPIIMKRWRIYCTKRTKNKGDMAREPFSHIGLGWGRYSRLELFRRSWNTPYFKWIESDNSYQHENQQFHSRVRSSVCFVREGVKTVTVKMFEMWNNVTTKLEVQQSQVQSQQPHTSSGSIKGRYIDRNLIYSMNSETK